MTYELAKELKDAGFRQTPSSKNKNPLNFRAPGFFLDAGTDTVYIPTLSELIEACGKEFDYLVHSSHAGHEGWYAEAGLIHQGGGIYFEAVVPTPEEAVARLWLALNI